MLGYKIAVGIDKEEGPFPVVVELDIPEDATVVIPKDKVEVEDYSDVGIKILLRPETKLIQKYRTDKVKVVDMWPLDDSVSNWNHKAYSVFELGKIKAALHLNPDYDFNCLTIYSIGVKLSERVLLSEKEPCGPGINYFNSLEDARDYYYNDVHIWAANLMHHFQTIWYVSSSIRSIKRFKETMVALSEEWS